MRNMSKRNGMCLCIPAPCISPTCEASGWGAVDLEDWSASTQHVDALHDMSSCGSRELTVQPNSLA